jgi:hypothetical protein
VALVPPGTKNVSAGLRPRVLVCRILISSYNSSSVH